MHSFTRVKFSPCFLHCRRCRRGSSWHPLEEDQSRKWVPTWKCTLPFPYECHQGRMPLGEFCITAKSIVATHETSDSVSIRPAFPFLVQLCKMVSSVKIPPPETFNFLRARTVYLELKLVFHQAGKSERGIKSFGFVLFRLILWNETQRIYVGN